jgi:uncharacterized membrane protein
VNTVGFTIGIGVIGLYILLLSILLEKFIKKSFKIGAYEKVNKEEREKYYRDVEKKIRRMVLLALIIRIVIYQCYSP